MALCVMYDKIRCEIDSRGRTIRVGFRAPVWTKSSQDRSKAQRSLPACHSERSEESTWGHTRILRCAQNDSQSGTRQVGDSSEIWLHSGRGIDEVMKYIKSAFILAVIALFLVACDSGNGGGNGQSTP